MLCNGYMGLFVDAKPACAGSWPRAGLKGLACRIAALEMRRPLLRAALVLDQLGEARAVVLDGQAHRVQFVAVVDEAVHDGRVERLAALPA